jgi:uncharacterized membrane protein (UPF0127 family)
MSAAPTEWSAYGAGGHVARGRCVVAATALARARGLLGRKALPPGEGLLLKPTFSVHMFFMRFPIDAVFIGRDGSVLRVAAHLKPWRAAMRIRARMVLELAAGEAERLGLSVGDRFELGDPAAEPAVDAKPRLGEGR